MAEQSTPMSETSSIVETNSFKRAAEQKQAKNTKATKAQLKQQKQAQNAYYEQ
jgi:hypothetical protein